MAGKETATPRNRMTKQIFYVDVRFSREVFANEWDRRNYLSSLGEARELYCAEIYAFCVLDNRIWLLSGGKDVKHRTVLSMISASLERFERETELTGEAEIIPAGTVIRAKVVRIENEDDAVCVMRYIHLMPMSEGCTITPLEFWWTSYNAYKGRYNWTMVDTAPVMRYLSLHGTSAGSSLSEYHRKGEIMRNPVPDCIRKGAYTLLSPGSPTLPQGNFNETFMVHG